MLTSCFELLFIKWSNRNTRYNAGSGDQEW